MAWFKVLKKTGRRSTNNLPELLGIKAAEKENPKKENPKESLSIFTKPACQYMDGKKQHLASCLI